jgi:hypothetical protein
MLQLLVTN